MIDSGSTHLHASLKFVRRLGRSTDKMNTPLGITLPSGEVMYSNKVLRACPIIVDDRELFVDLIVVDINEYEIILGIDWLSKYHAKTDCKKKIVVFHPPDTDQFIFKSIQISSRFTLISAMGYLVSIVDVYVEQKLRPEDVSVVQDFLDLFLEYLPGLPPE